MSVLVRAPNLLIALLVINVLLLAPRWLLTGSLGPSWIALEALLVAGVFALLPGRRWTAVLAAVTALILVLLSTLAFADAVLRQSLARPLNVYLDLYLLSALSNLLIGSLGSVIAVLAMVGSVLGAGLVTWLLASLLAPSVTHTPGLATRVTGVALITLSTVGLTGIVTGGPSERLALPAIQIANEQVRQVSLMLTERERFATDSAATPASYAEVPGLLRRLRDHDVVLAFVESYGMSALDDPRYAPVIRPRLHDLARRMGEADLHLATGTLVAPTQGGQSWFSHGSLLSGMWLDNQLRYNLLLASDRETLIDDFSRAGHRTVALMPATTLPWPEGERLGYDQILTYREIDYAGPALNWVTMPDQFTWSFLEHSVRASDADQPEDDRPLFAEVSLISSHAPWTPILPVLDDWDSIGDGSVFAPWANAGETPADLWRDSDRVREHFALSVDYAINAMSGYAERFVDARTLLIVIGDHQPAPLITGDEASRAVPIHVMSGDRSLLQPFLDWGFNPGAFPDSERPAPAMDRFRDWFIRAFSVPAAGGGKTSTAHE